MNIYFVFLSFEMQAENSLNIYVTATFYRKLHRQNSVPYNFPQ